MGTLMTYQPFFALGQGRRYTKKKFQKIPMAGLWPSQVARWTAPSTTSSVSSFPSVRVMGLTSPERAQDKGQSKRLAARDTVLH
jgi:hypothetical protein